LIELIWPAGNWAALSDAVSAGITRPTIVCVPLGGAGAVTPAVRPPDEMNPRTTRTVAVDVRKGVSTR
jgi:hypothetical protein